VGNIVCDGYSRLCFTAQLLSSNAGAVRRFGGACEPLCNISYCGGIACSGPFLTMPDIEHKKLLW
jgi:hypothetical protein